MRRGGLRRYNEAMTATLTATSIGHDLITRLMAGDSNGAADLLAPNVHVRGVTPGRFLDIADRDSAIKAFNNWFKAGWREGLECFENGETYGRTSMTYRVRWSDAYGQRFVFEQHVYYETNDEGISWLELMCSGHRPVS